jgi:hypothetical protein
MEDLLRKKVLCTSNYLFTVFPCCKFSNFGFLDVNLPVSSAEFKTGDMEMTVKSGLKNRILTSVDWIQNLYKYLSFHRV